MEGLLSFYFACLYLWSKFQFELGMAHFAFVDYLGSLGLTLMDYHEIAGVELDKCRHSWRGSKCKSYLVLLQKLFEQSLVDFLAK